MKNQIEQEIIKRSSQIYDEGEMGFSDYVTKWEDYKDFVSRVSDVANDIVQRGKVINIAYPTENIAIIVWEKR